MDKEEWERKQFLEEQLEWCIKQDQILEKIEMRLREMKIIVQTTLDYELTVVEVERLNGQLNELKSEVHFLEKQLHSVVH
ncbi:hypothetical protein [Bacillus cihuensis]|uniref:hypothetical protein n=1 Tax=Bacillus cihuensis TaxID=1208599 RepID=UPI0003FCFA03|nr:hypothetical protein [Bacillus cihuensis]